jgi:hypothetical protein
MSNELDVLSTSEERALACELAQRVLEVTAPEELLIFDLTAEEYFADPEGVLKAEGKDQPVGFGVELALMTPFVLAVVSPVVKLLATMVSDAVKAEGQQAVSGFIRRLLRRPRANAPVPIQAQTPVGHPTSLTCEQLGLVRNVAFERGRSVGLTGDQAALLADAIAGGLAVRPST